MMILEKLQKTYFQLVIR